MKFYWFGKKENPVIFLLPGTCCHWKANFGGVTPLETDISVPGTTIHCFYAAKMGGEYLQRYQKHFRQPDIRRQELQHEELLVSYPEKWAEEVKSCCGLLPVSGEDSQTGKQSVMA